VAEGIEQRAGRPVPADAGPTGALPAGVSLSDGLNEDEAVTLALARNPDFQADLADLLFAGASLQEAGQFRNPVLTLLFPWGPQQLEATVKWPFDALWLRPRRVAAARLDADAVVERLVARGLSLAADARIAYADAMAARLRAATVSEAARVRERIGEIAEARLKAGDVSPFEIGAHAGGRGPRRRGAGPGSRRRAGRRGPAARAARAGRRAFHPVPRPRRDRRVRGAARAPA